MTATIFKHICHENNNYTFSRGTIQQKLSVNNTKNIDRKN